MENMKHCKKCNESKPSDSFHKDKRSRDGLYVYCKECNKAKSRAWNADNRDKIADRDRKRRQADPNYDRSRNYKAKYGITLEQYNEMFANQGGVCAVCAQPERRKETDHLAVDHNHATGQVRGLLCSNCNRAIGLLEDDPKRMMAAASYLRRSAAE